MPVQPLPIFALTFVIFPGERIPFRIYEPRYKAMVKDCLDESGERGKREFGILFATDRDNAEVGCCVQVDRVLKRYSDGSIDILTRGTRRFFVQRFVSGRTYPQAIVGYYDDDAFPDCRLANVASSLHTKLIELTTEKVEVPLFEAHDLVSFLLGHNLRSANLFIRGGGPFRFRKEHRYAPVIFALPLSATYPLRAMHTAHSTQDTLVSLDRGARGGGHHLLDALKRGYGEIPSEEDRFFQTRWTLHRLLGRFTRVSQLRG